jgi:hypothetical protein
MDFMISLSIGNDGCDAAGDEIPASVHLAPHESFIGGWGHNLDAVTAEICVGKFPTKT